MQNYKLFFKLITWNYIFRKKNCWYHKCTPLIANPHALVKASCRKRHPVQDTKVKLYTLFNTQDPENEQVFRDTYQSIRSNKGVPQGGSHTVIFFLFVLNGRLFSMHFHFKVIRNEFTAQPTSSQD